MKFIISSTTLLRGLQKVSGVLGTNNTLPILEDFLFEMIGDVDGTENTKHHQDDNQSSDLELLFMYTAVHVLEQITDRNNADDSAALCDDRHLTAD